MLVVTMHHIVPHITLLALKPICRTQCNDNGSILCMVTFLHLNLDAWVPCDARHSVKCGDFFGGDGVTYGASFKPLFTFL